MECTVTKLIKSGGRVCAAFAYERELGKFKLFKARAIVMATGGIGRAFKITSNSWEYTGDGHSLAYHAGADLIDMEFVQFHPTGMVWPPSVKGILVTEGVRGEGGILKNKDGKRFMFDDIPDNYKSSTADNEAEGWRYVTKTDRSARRPPELLTRDHVARCILREVKEGRGSPHGGAFLDIAWIKEKIPNGEAHIKKKLPSMYHQFKELAGIDITKEPMEVGPTTHYVMGGIRVDGESQMSTIDGLFAAGECAAGLHGANRLGGNSLSDLIVFGKLAGEHAASYAKEKGAVEPSADDVNAAHAEALAPLDDSRAEVAGGAYQIQYELQDMMQEKVGIIRKEEELVQAVEGIEQLKERAKTVHAPGNRQYNPGWHTALDLKNLLLSAEAVARSAIVRKESRGAHTRDDYPEKGDAFDDVNTVLRMNDDGSMSVTQEKIPSMPEELAQIIEDHK
ncbi:MAG: FAD-binding protein, partial [Planctomycetota bacterium]